MKFVGALAAITASLSLINAQGNATNSICDRYTTALLMENNATNQATVLTLVVNTALIGNYTNPAGPAMNAVTGILNNGTYQGTPVSLLKYFDGSLASTNRNGQATSLSFLDGGGAAPLMQNMPAWANATSSRQHALVTHLYQLFGSLLGCSMQTENGPFPTYQGDVSMSSVHRFMNLDRAELGYFIQEVGLSATSFGVTMEDATTVGNALNQTFGFRCLPPAPLVPGAANASQSTCLASDCPTRQGATQCEASGNSFGNGTNGVAPQAAAQNGGGSSSGGSGGGRDSSSVLLVNTVGALALVAAGAIAVSL